MSGYRPYVQARLIDVDKTYVRGDHDIRTRTPPIRATSIVARARTEEGKTLLRRSVAYGITAFYNREGYVPTRAEAKAAGIRLVPDWIVLIRELGLCPRRRITEKDVLGEFRRIYERDGLVTIEALQRAKLLTGNEDRYPRVCIPAMRNKYGASPKNYGPLLDSMGIPHDLRSRENRRVDEDLKAWILHLEAGKRPIDDMKLYQRISRRGFRAYSDAVTELRKREIDNWRQDGRSKHHR
jgi:hypothetical protein